jgi:hypothetical protein
MIKPSQVQTIESVKKLPDILTISFQNVWFQEDIELLTKLVFTPLVTVNIQEKILGADRENIRFIWQDHCFILNFDCYSQSCWLEGQDSQSSQFLVLLYEALKHDG